MGVNEETQAEIFLLFLSLGQCRGGGGGGYLTPQVLEELMGTVLPFSQGATGSPGSGFVGGKSQH